MNPTVSYAVNFGLGWSIALLAVLGYALTLKRTGQKWLFWVALATGWALFAMAQVPLMIGRFDNLPFLIALWLSSWVLVVVSLLLGFLKLVKFKQQDWAERA